MPKGIPKSGKRKSTKRVGYVCLKCSVCGLEKSMTPSAFKARTGKFCSKVCEGRSRINPLTMHETKCSFCGVIFNKRKDHLHERNFCSRRCVVLSRKLPDAKWRDPIKIKEYMVEYIKKYNILNIHAVRARTAYRRSLKRNATPKWADKIKIKEFYKAAREAELKTGKPYQVDHIIPIISKVVCGLHVHENLQILPALQNRIKGNKFEITEV